MYPDARMAKAVHVSAAVAAGRGYRANQDEVWNLIAEKAGRMGTHSRTRAMRDVYRQHGRRVDDYVAAFGAVERQAGVVFGLGSEVSGIELFDHPRTLAALLPKLVRSYALDAMEVDGGRRAHAVPAREAVERFLREVGEEARAETRPSVGLGQDVRLAGPRVVGGALVHDGRLMHLSAFRTSGAEPRREGWTDTAEGESGAARFTRSSARRERRR